MALIYKSGKRKNDWKEQGHSPIIGDSRKHLSKARILLIILGKTQKKKRGFLRLPVISKETDWKRPKAPKILTVHLILRWIRIKKSQMMRMMLKLSWWVQVENRLITPANLKRKKLMGSIHPGISLEKIQRISYFCQKKSFQPSVTSSSAAMKVQVHMIMENSVAATDTRTILTKSMK